MYRDERYVTQTEAASLCGCDYTTIRRHRNRGHFPGARRRDDVNGSWEIPVEDLISAGLWHPSDGDERDLDGALGRTRTERRLEELRLELERANVRIEGLTSALADRRDEIAYLRRALDAALGASPARVVA
ncbi:MAG TPA: helix-turn-helix domain-containing protein [Acidimicrobiales bacterium]|nr:helix-turn-helix domain-containing protein [Acidimicrobiales bacterium]